MLDRPTCPLRRGFVSSSDHFECLIGIEKTRHDVETAIARSPGLYRIRGQPGMRAPPQAPLLAFIDCLGRIAMFANAATLDFDENEQSSAGRDQVDLYSYIFSL